MIRKLFCGLMCAADIMVVYLFVGNLLRGINGVQLIGEADIAHFMGYYMLAGGYFALLLICALVTALAFVSTKRANRARSIGSEKTGSGSEG